MADVVAFLEDSTLLILDPSQDWNAQAPVWSWSPSQAAEIAAAHRPWFNQGRDAKVVRGGSQILVASESVIALINRNNGSVPFYASSPTSTHSAALLPDGNVVSVGLNGFVRVTSTDPAVAKDPLNPVCSPDYSLNNAHGVVWDKTRQCVWALGSRKEPQPVGPPNYFGIVHQYQYKGTAKAPMLELLKKQEFPGKREAHDFFPTGDGKSLLASFELHVWNFDPDAWTISKHPFIWGESQVKAVSELANGDCAFTYETLTIPHKWDTDQVQFYDVATAKKSTKQKMNAAWYKARWAVTNSFSE